MSKLTRIKMFDKTAEDDFEQKLAQMADAEISQSMPSLTPYKVGFQVIDKNDDETRGAGIMVYKFKDQWIYIPAFFLNGRLRGYDEMYLPDKQQMVPSKDNWLSYISSRQPIMLGEPQTDDNVRPKKAADVAFTEGRYNTIMNKRAAFDACSLLGNLGLRGFDDFLGFPEDQFDLKTYIPKFGKTAAINFLTALNKSADFANAVLKYYSPEDIGMIAKVAIETGAYPVKVKEAPNSKSNLVIYTKEDMNKAKDDLDETAKEVLLRDGVYVVDGRDSTSSVFQPRDTIGNLHSPTGNGYYDVLMADGSFKEFYIIVKRGVLTNCKAQDGNASFFLIPSENSAFAIQIDDPILARHLNKNPEDIQKFGMTPASFIRVSRDLGNRFILLDKAGIGFPIHAKGQTSIMGDKMTGAYDENMEDIMLQFTGAKGNVYRVANTIYIPETARIIRSGDYSEKNKYVFGDLNTLKLRLQKSSGMEPLKIYTDRTSFSISGKFGEEAGLTKVAAFLSLVKKHGIDAPTAKLMTNLQPKQLDKVASERYMIKYAATMDSVMDATAGGYEDAPRTQETEVINPGISANDISTAVKASDAGVKDVMDVSILKALAMNSNSGRLINDYIPDLLVGLDRLGRLMFMFYWHNDDFKDRYGTDKMMELEDSIRDTFHGVGDLILFLHKSTVDPSVDLLSGDLSKNMG